MTDKTQSSIIMGLVSFGVLAAWLSVFSVFIIIW